MRRKYSQDELATILGVSMGIPAELAKQDFEFMIQQRNMLRMDAFGISVHQVRARYQKAWIKTGWVLRRIILDEARKAVDRLLKVAQE